jgi:hypothetical protein
MVPSTKRYCPDRSLWSRLAMKSRLDQAMSQKGVKSSLRAATKESGLPIAIPAVYPSGLPRPGKSDRERTEIAPTLLLSCGEALPFSSCWQWAH